MTTLNVEGLCPECAKKIENAISLLPGIQSAHVSFECGKVEFITAGDHCTENKVKEIKDTISKISPEVKILN